MVYSTLSALEVRVEILQIKNRKVRLSVMVRLPVTHGGFNYFHLQILWSQNSRKPLESRGWGDTFCSLNLEAAGAITTTVRTWSSGEEVWAITGLMKDHGSPRSGKRPPCSRQASYEDEKPSESTFSAYHPRNNHSIQF